MAARGTKDEIIDTALELFNAQGTSPVSTNHIAEAMGTSPGKVYYHFSNKEEIIRAIYERAIADYDDFLAEVAQVTPDPVTMLGWFDGIFDHQWKYRFLQREFPRSYGRTRNSARVTARCRIADSASTDSSAGTGSRAAVSTPCPKEELADLVMAIWLVGDTWLSYLRPWAEAMTRTRCVVVRVSSTAAAATPDRIGAEAFEMRADALTGSTQERSGRRMRLIIGGMGSVAERGRGLMTGDSESTSTVGPHAAWAVGERSRRRMGLEGGDRVASETGSSTARERDSTGG